MERDRQLISKIKEHTQKVQERKSRPRGNPQMEKDMAQKDLVEVRKKTKVLGPHFTKLFISEKGQFLL